MRLLRSQVENKIFVAFFFARCLSSSSFGTATSFFASESKKKNAGSDKALPAAIKRNARKLSLTETTVEALASSLSELCSRKMKPELPRIALVCIRATIPRQSGDSLHFLANRESLKSLAAQAITAQN